MTNDRRGPPASAPRPGHHGGMRQVARDRANVSDSPLGALVRFLRDLQRDAQRRNK